MSLPTAPRASGPDDDDPPAPARTFVLIVVVEALTIGALYWFGLHFA